MKTVLMEIAVAVAAILIYACSCWWFPLAKCYCCKGLGAHARKDGKVFRPCWWCSGSGHRWRIGRRVWNFFRRHAHT